MWESTWHNIIFDLNNRITIFRRWKGKCNVRKEICWYRSENDEWWSIEIGEAKIAVKNHVWHHLKLWYCPDCSYRMPKVEEGEGLLRLFSQRKVLQFKKDVLPAHEVAL